MRIQKSSVINAEESEKIRSFLLQGIRRPAEALLRLVVLYIRESGAKAPLSFFRDGRGRKKPRRVGSIRSFAVLFDLLLQRVEFRSGEELAQSDVQAVAELFDGDD